MCFFVYLCFQFRHFKVELVQVFVHKSDQCLETERESQSQDNKQNNTHHLNEPYLSHSHQNITFSTGPQQQLHVFTCMYIYSHIRFLQVHLCCVCLYSPQRIHRFTFLFTITNYKMIYFIKCQCHLCHVIFPDLWTSVLAEKMEQTKMPTYCSNQIR